MVVAIWTCESCGHEPIGDLGAPMSKWQMDVLEGAKQKRDPEPIDALGVWVSFGQLGFAVLPRINRAERGTSMV